MALLELKNLKTFFTTKRGIVKAVNDVSYSVEPGKVLGVVGESGSGKSVSAMSILQLLDGNGFDRIRFCDLYIFFRHTEENRQRNNNQRQ